jgi:hypothetical protein
MYEILIHTRECPQGWVWAVRKGIEFKTKQEAEVYANKYALGWRWHGYYTIRKKEER